MSDKENKTIATEENKITTVEKSVKVKDPKRVEMGKRLAKISKEAKERKARQHFEQEEKEKLSLQQKESKEITDYIDFRYFVGGVTLAAALGGLYFSYKQDKRDETTIRQMKMTNNEKKCLVENL